MLDNYLQETVSADGIFRCIFVSALRVNAFPPSSHSLRSLRVGLYVADPHILSIYRQHPNFLSKVSRSVGVFLQTCKLTRFWYLSYDVASGSEITSCNKIGKPLLLHKRPCRTLFTAMFKPAKTHVFNITLGVHQMFMQRTVCLIP